MRKVGLIRSVRAATAFRNADILDVQLVGEADQPRAVPGHPLRIYGRLRTR